MNLNATREIPTIDLLEKLIIDDKYFQEFSNSREENIYGFRKKELENRLRDYIANTMRNQGTLSPKFLKRAKYYNDKFNFSLPLFRQVDDGLDPELTKYIMEEIKAFNDPLTQARAVYLKLAKVLCFNEHVPAYNQNLFNPVMEDIYYSKTSSVTLNNNKVTCKLWAEVYAECLRELNIEVKVVGNGKHKYVEFNIDGVTYTADATNSFLDKENIYLNDLTRVKLNSPTFGFSANDNFDQQIGYQPKSITEQYHEYSNNHYALSNMRLTTGNHEIDKIVSKLDYLSTMAYKLPLIEAVGYLEQMLRTPNSIVTQEELEKIMPRQIRLIDNNGLNYTSLVIAIKNGEEYIYKLLNVPEGLITVEKDYFKNLMANGKMLDDSNIPGISQMTR